MLVTKVIPVSRFNQFHEILVSTGGRYKYNPQIMFNNVYVTYYPGDYVEQCKRWNMITTEIKETYKNQW